MTIIQRKSGEHETRTLRPCLALCISFTIIDPRLLVIIIIRRRRDRARPKTLPVPTTSNPTISISNSNNAPASKEMYDAQPSAQDIHDRMQPICIRHPINRRIQREGEEQDVCEMTRPAPHSRHHLPGAERFDEQDEGEDGEDVVGGGKWRQTADGEVARPDD